MPSPSFTYTLTNGTTADADQVMQNFDDILNGVTDGTKDLSIAALTVAGTLTANGNINLGNSSSDTITVTGTPTFGAATTFSNTATFSSNATFSAQALISNGTASAPSVSFSSDSDGSGTGIYRIAANSLGFSANGTEVGRYSSAGAWRLGPAAGLSGTFQSTANVMLVGGDDLNSSGNFLIIGRRSSGTKTAYITAGSGSECGMEFASRDSGNAYLNVGGYSSAGAWTFGNGTGEVHRFNCQTNGTAPGAVSTYMRINVNGTTYKVALLGNT